ncbi:MAG: DUF1844 domain-containing protein [Deltaproteobacteria bacterium]|jgi:hypothetical protein|nr:DUF1844 domain-containing protein [Deltaproteobacteria bacterium]
MAEEKDEKKDFVVKDRRIFAEGNLDAAETEQKETPAPEKDQAHESPKSKEDSARQQPEPPPQFPEINFATFVASLNASALLQLGAIEDPTTGQKNKNLPMAKQTIDIISMLQEKTAGNLSEEEENLLKNILYDLRIMYVKEKK